MLLKSSQQRRDSKCKQRSFFSNLNQCESINNSSQDYNESQSEIEVNKVNPPLRFNTKSYKQDTNIKQLFKSRSKILSTSTNRLIKIKRKSVFDPQILNVKDRNQVDSLLLQSQQSFQKNRKTTIEESIIHQHSLINDTTDFEETNQFPNQFQELRSDLQFNQNVTNQKEKDSMHKQERDKTQREYWQLKSTAPTAVGFLKKGVSLKIDMPQQNSDPSIPSHKVIMRKQLTNTDSPASELKTTKTLKSWRSMNTTRTILTDLDDDHHLEAARIQKISQSLWSTVCKIKPHDCEGFIIRKKVMKVQQVKSQELELLSNCSGHPFIVCLFDAYQISQTNGHFIEMLMEYYPSGDLKRKIYLQGAMQLLRVKLYAYQIFRGLHFLHSQQICHRDLRSQNIFLRSDKLVIGDLSESILLDSSGPPPFCLGEHEERAPELVFDSCSAYNEKIDIWAAGCIIMEMILGRKLFSTNCSNQDLLIQIIKIRGFPTDHEIQSLSKNHRSILEFWKLPKNTTAKPWREVLEQQQINHDFDDLLNGLFQYSPSCRLSALEALCHPFFDQIRNEQQYERIKTRYDIEDDLFYYLPNQVPDHLVSMLAPSWTLKSI